MLPTASILEASADWIAPGHNAITTDRNGDDWIVYHAVDARRPRARDSDEINTRRIMLIDRIEWVDGWPRVAGGRPSSGPLPAPKMRPR